MTFEITFFSLCTHSFTLLVPSLHFNCLQIVPLILYNDIERLNTPLASILTVYVRTLNKTAIAAINYSLAIARYSITFVIVSV